MEKNTEKEIVTLVIDDFKLSATDFEARLTEALHTEFDCIIDFRLNVITPYIKVLDQYKKRFNNLNKTMVICTKNLDWSANLEQHDFVPTILECHDFIEFDRIERELSFEFNPEEDLDKLDD